MNLTDKGLTEVGSSLREAKALLRRRRGELQSKLGAIEAEMVALGKIEAALDFSVDMLLADKAAREVAS